MNLNLHSGDIVTSILMFSMGRKILNDGWRLNRSKLPRYTGIKLCLQYTVSFVCVSCNSQRVFLQYCSSIRFYGHPHPHACYHYTITQLHSLDSHADCDDGNFSVFTSVLTTPLAQWCVLFLNNKKQLKQFPVFIQTSWNNLQFSSKPVETISSFHPNQLKQFPVFIHTYFHDTASHNTWHANWPFF